MGMFLVTPYLQDIGEHLWLQAEVAGGRKIQLRGKVQWKRCVPAQLQALSKPGFGIQLLYAPEEWYWFLLNALPVSSAAKS
jgi:Tfp pilus assembly protein PilZ